MLQRIKAVEPLPGYCLRARFEDGHDVKEDMAQIPSYLALATIAGLFGQVQLDESRTCVFWSDEIDLPSDMIYEYGKKCE